MTCYVMVSVISESVTGDIGDDWKYTITGTTTGDDGLPQHGSLTQDEHEIEPGAEAQDPPKPIGFTLNAGECGGVANIALTIKATEVDWLFDDTGSTTRTVTINCPGPGAPRNSKTEDVSLTVKENPAILGGQAKLNLKLSIVAYCQ